MVLGGDDMLLSDCRPMIGKHGRRVKAVAGAGGAGPEGLFSLDLIFLRW